MQAVQRRRVVVVNYVDTFSGRNCYMKVIKVDPMGPTKRIFVFDMGFSCQTGRKKIKNKNAFLKCHFRRKQNSFSIFIQSIGTRSLQFAFWSTSTNSSHFHHTFSSVKHFRLPHMIKSTTARDRNGYICGTS